MRFIPPQASTPSPSTTEVALPSDTATVRVMPFRGAVELFIGRTGRTKSGSPHTARAYRTDLRDFERFLTDRGLTLHSVRRREAEAFITILSARVCARTVDRRVSTLRSFYKFLGGIDEVTTNPFTAHDLPSFDRKSETHKVLTRDELERLSSRLSSDVADANRAFGKAAKAKRPRAFASLMVATRRRACLSLMAFGGLRVAEVLALPKHAFQTRADGFSLTFTGKGNKTRSIPLVGFAYPAMFDWLTVRRHLPTSSQSVFVTMTGRPVWYSQIERSCVRLGEKIKTQVRLTPHVLRRTFATQNLKASGDIRAVQVLLGHASIQTTQFYTHVDEESLRRLVEATGHTMGIGQREHANGPLVRALT